MKNVLYAALVFFAASSPAVSQQQTPVDVYNAYNVAVKTAKSWDDISPYMSSTQMEEIKMASPQEQKMMFGFIVDVASARQDIKITSDSVQGDTGMVAAEFCMDNMRASETVDFIMEAGTWRIGKVNLQLGDTRCDGVTGTPCTEEEKADKVDLMQSLINAYPETDRDAIVNETNEKVFAQMGGRPAEDQYCDFVDAFNTTLAARP